MKFLDPASLKISEIGYADHLQFDLSAKDFLTMKVVDLTDLFISKMPKPQHKNKPVSYLVTLIEEEDYVLHERHLRIIPSLMLNSLSGSEVTREPFVKKIPKELNEVYASDLSILNYINYGTGHPIQIAIRRNYIQEGVVLDSEVYYLI